jgi:hypothetical protein
MRRDLGKKKTLGTTHGNEEVPNVRQKNKNISNPSVHERKKRRAPPRAGQ